MSDLSSFLLVCRIAQSCVEELLFPKRLYFKIDFDSHVRFSLRTDETILQEY